MSVTELQSLINKPFLNKWRESLCVPNERCGFVEGRRIAEEAAVVGNQVHEEFSTWFSGKDLPAVSSWFIKFKDKATELKIEKYLIEPETNLVDSESGLAGSPDFVGQSKYKFDEMQYVIGDLKIKNSLDPITALQGCGYRYLIKRLHNVDIETMLVLWAQKKSKSMTVKDVWINLDDWNDEWEALVILWNRLNPSRRVTLLE